MKLDQRISIITLAVADLQKSKDFYHRVFGWNPIAGPEDEEQSIAFYQMGCLQFALYPIDGFAKEHAANVSKPGGFSLAYNVNSIEEVDELFKHFVETKTQILKAPEKVFWGGYSGYIAGPDGENWEIAYNPFTRVNDDGSFGEKQQL